MLLGDPAGSMRLSQQRNTVGCVMTHCAGLLQPTRDPATRWEFTLTKYGRHACYHTDSEFEVQSAAVNFGNGAVLQVKSQSSAACDHLTNNESNDNSKAECACTVHRCRQLSGPRMAGAMHMVCALLNWKMLQTAWGPKHE